MNTTRAENYKSLVCPLGKYPLKLIDDKLVCTNCGAAFIFKDSIACLLIDEAILPEGIENKTKLACYKSVK
jgi:uncharacterized protein YbaR (Trm112 family)